MGADVDTVQELTDILVLAEASLANQGSRAGDEVDIWTNKDEFIFDRGALVELIWGSQSSRFWSWSIFFIPK